MMAFLVMVDHFKFLPTLFKVFFEYNEGIPKVVLNNSF